MAREVREETGVVARLEGLVSLRHAHARAFGQGDTQAACHPQPNPYTLPIPPPLPPYSGPGSRSPCAIRTQ